MRQKISGAEKAQTERSVTHMAEKKRQANFELLRILAMFMVVIMHFLAASGVVTEGRPRDGLYLFGILTESLCICAVNVYVLLSGYFLSTAAFSLKRVVRLIAQTLFYTVLIPVLLVAAGQLDLKSALNIYSIWPNVFPIQSGHYWFVTAYVVMSLFAPCLNAALEKLSQKDMGRMLAALLLFFCIGKTLSPLQFATDKYGYDFGWFLVLYLMGGYIRRYGVGFFDNKRKSAGLYLASAGVIAMAELVFHVLAEKIEGLVYYSSVPFHYNFLFCLTGALGLFFLFYHLKIKEGKMADGIRFVSPAVLGVYLIHEHWQVKPLWFSWLNGLFSGIGLGVALDQNGMAQMGVLFYGIVMLLQVFALFGVCILIDRARGFLFEKAQARFQKQRTV